MGMTMGIYTVSDANLERIAADPPLVWQLVAPEDREIYEESRADDASRPGWLARLFGKNARPTPDLTLASDEGQCCDLDKAWHGIHYLLTRKDAGAHFPEGFLLIGGRPAGDIEVGYGPVRLFASREVQRIHECLRDIGREELIRRFDPARMMEFEIYPTIWDRPAEEDDTLGYLLEYFDSLSAFLNDAARSKLGLAIALV
jgi:hypothetical protein